MSDHPFIPKSNSKIVPPFIPKPKESLEAENTRLKAENERLRKAGGWLYTELECFHRNEFCDHPDYEEERPSMKAWNAAKEGKPSV